MSVEDPTFVKVRDTLVDALGIDDDEVRLDSRLEVDLGAESIDKLDIIFRLEKNFAIKIPRGEMFPEDLASTDHNFVRNGNVTQSGLSHLQKKAPHLDLTIFKQDPKVENIKDMYTVEMIVNFVKKRIADANDQAK